MAREDDEWWCHGVEPGGITERGGSPPDAFSAFRDAFKTVLTELAAEAATFSGFQKAVQDFFSPDTAEEARWVQALAKQREAGPEPPFDSLPQREFSESFVAVERISVPAFEQGEMALPKAA